MYGQRKKQERPTMQNVTLFAFKTFMGSQEIRPVLCGCTSELFAGRMGGVVVKNWFLPGLIKVKITN
jgi:hypothetical protein